MTLVLALPLIASSLSTPIANVEAASVSPFPSLSEAAPDGAARKQCRSQFVTANTSRQVNASHQKQAVWRRGVDDRAPLFLFAVDRRIAGCEVIVPVGDPDRPIPLPKFPEPDTPSDLLHPAGD